MLNKKSVDDINVKGKRVLVRCDFNVPLKRRSYHRRKPSCCSSSNNQKINRRWWKSYSLLTSWKTKGRTKA